MTNAGRARPAAQQSQPEDAPSLLFFRVAVSATSGTLPPSTGSTNSACFKYCSRDSTRVSRSTATVPAWKERA